MEARRARAGVSAVRLPSLRSSLNASQQLVSKAPDRARRAPHADGCPGQVSEVGRSMARTSVAAFEVATALMRDQASATSSVPLSVA